MAEARQVISKRPSKNQWQLAVLRYSKVITLLLVIIIFAGSYFLVLEPKYQQVGIGGQYNVDTLTTELEKREKYVTEVKALIANYQQLGQSDIVKLEQILPHKKDIPGLFVQLEEIAKENGMQLAGISINEVPDVTRIKDDGVIGKMNITVNLIGETTGGYRIVKDYLASVERSLRLFDVNAVYFSPGSPNYTVSLFTYYFQEQ